MDGFVRFKELKVTGFVMDYIYIYIYEKTRISGRICLTC